MLKAFTVLIKNLVEYNFETNEIITVTHFSIETSFNKCNIVKICFKIIFKKFFILNAKTNKGQ